MKKSIQNIVVFILLSVFLSATNGVFFVQHYCSVSGRTELHFNAPAEENCCQETGHCCAHGSKEAEGQQLWDHFDKLNYAASLLKSVDCCTNISFFLKIICSFINTVFSFTDTNALFLNHNISEIFSFTANTPFRLNIINTSAPWQIPVFIKNSIFRL
ncbi:MAG TPA: hypothetical protein PKW80_16285 [Bacteroidales bacterium]|nr:hypothetical protein [Bacteroidales bacterium]